MIFFIALSDRSTAFITCSRETAGEEHDNHNASPIGFLVSRTLGCMEIGKRCVLGIGSEMPLGHDSYVTTCL